MLESSWSVWTTWPDYIAEHSSGTIVGDYADNTKAANKRTEQSLAITLSNAANRIAQRGIRL